jgi:glycosyltransferase involved in cell wall biosynthesis
VNSTSELVSVLTTVHNGAGYLGEMIESVLAQTHRPLDVVVVDDGSEDSSAEVAMRFAPAVRVVRQRRRMGIGVSRNRAVAIAQGDFLTFPDADDRLAPNAIARMIAAFEARPGLDAVHAHVREFISPELEGEARERLRPATRPMPGRLPSATLIRAGSFARVGRFATDLRAGESVDWAVRLIEARLVTTIVPDVLYERRLHRDNLSSRERHIRAEYLHVLKASLDRRRAAGQSRRAQGQSTTRPNS